MRIDLPGCNIKTCCYCFDDNCTKPEQYERCDYGIMKEKYEYHYDHTDCIWYPDGSSMSTCAQYRDGWNDAMSYIFMDGEGYKPYCRK